MNFLSSFFGGSAATQQNALNSEQQEFIARLKHSDGVFKVMKEDTIENLLCTYLQDVEFSVLKTNASRTGQDKFCQFQTANISFRSMEVEGADGKMVVPCLSLENTQYDPDQEQEKEMFLPISQDMIMLYYDDAEEIKGGLVFFYPTTKSTWLIEMDNGSIEQTEEIEKFKFALAQTLYSFHKQKDPSDVSKDEVSQFCMDCQKSLVFQSESLMFIVEDTEADQPDQQKVNQAQSSIEQQQVIDQLGGLQLAKSDEEVAADKIKIKVLERVMQLNGGLFKYDSTQDKNLLVQPATFMCIDKIESDSGSKQYMINVLDHTQAISYTRIIIEQDPALNYSLNEQDKLLMWIGNPKEDSLDIPAWCFVLESEDDVKKLKGSLTKAIFETNIQESLEKACESQDLSYLEHQIIGGDKPDVDMAEVDQISDFDIEDEYFRVLQDDEEEKEETKPKVQLGFTDEDIDESDDENSCSLQSQQFLLNYVASGPVVKVYQKSEGENSVLYKFKTQKFKNEAGEVVNPTNLMLRKGETSLIFNDANDRSQLFNFDLHTGKIVEQFEADSSKKNGCVNHFTNTQKNGQTTEEETFVAVSDNSIFLLDPRINKKKKAAEGKTYKTMPYFSKVSTTLDGGLAIGSHTGDIRLYKQVGQNAKTLLPGLGAPIRGIEMSRDGNWVLATTQTYLLLIPTLCSNGKTGFEKSMGKEKPDPIRLELNAMDIAKYQIRGVSFTTAYFNNFNQDHLELTSIVATTGRFLVTWNFKKIMRGLRRAYVISELSKDKGAKIVDSQFMFNDDEKVLITEKKAVGMQTRSRKQKKD